MVEQVDETNQYSFYTSDSYSLIVKGPDPAKTKKKPAGIPTLDLNKLPEYESSSEEEEDVVTEETKEGGSMNDQQYGESLKYIENFYQHNAEI